MGYTHVVEVTAIVTVSASSMHEASRKATAKVRGVADIAVTDIRRSKIRDK